MAYLSKLKLKKAEIRLFFENLAQKVFRGKSLELIFEQQKDKWEISASTSRFLKFLETDLGFYDIKLEFSAIEKPILLKSYTSNLYAIATAIQTDAYISHFSAAFLHGLTEQVPKTVYISVPQTGARNPNTTLLQESIDAAFSKPARSSKNTAIFGAYEFVWLYAKTPTTSGIGVSKFTQDNIIFPITTIERTLLDMVVRPHYSGGVDLIIEAFRRASTLGISINKIASLIRTIDYTYPYAQAVGFYMEISKAYTEKQLKVLDSFEKKYNFYLLHNSPDNLFSNKWKIYYPAYLGVCE